MKFDQVSIIGARSLNLKIFTNLYQILINSFEILNRNFTFHLVPIVASMLAFNIFLCYGVLSEFVSNSKIKMYTLLLNLSWIVMMYLLMGMMAYSGSSVATKANEVKKTVNRILNDFEMTNDFTLKLHNFLTRLQCQNLEVRNVFFAINWQILVAVRARNI
jgi:hypothetical protein